MSGGLSVPSPKGLFPLSGSQQMVSSGSATGNPRNKVALRPGFSLMDWVKLTKSGKDLAGTGGRIIGVTPKELAKHNKRSDAWMAINGKVYNVTAYMEFHPGGWDELIRGAGKDATSLFNEVHRWVNYESMLAACLVGKLIEDEEISPAAKLPSAKAVIPPIKRKPSRPSMDSHQTEATFVLSIYTRRPNVTLECVVAEVIHGSVLRCLVRFPDEQMLFRVHLRLHGKARLRNVKCAAATGKVEVVLAKDEAAKWPNMGQALDNNDVYEPESQSRTAFRDWVLVSRAAVTPDVDHLVLEYPKKDEKLHFCVPMGHHVQLQGDVEDVRLERSYTPVFNGLALAEKDDSRIHLLIKTYPLYGSLTPYLKTLKTGQSVAVSDPLGSFTPSRLLGLSQLILLAAGTGFTPMAKLMQHFLADEKHTVVLVVFSKKREDIIWRDEIDKLSSACSKRLTVRHVLSEDPEAGENFDSGRISKDILERFLPSNDDSKGVFICGPIGFNQLAQRLLKELNFKNVYVFQG